MPSMRERSMQFEGFMLAPRHGPGVCTTCLNLTNGYSRCYACAHCEAWLDAVVPISYSVAREPLHRALAGYKRSTGQAQRRLATGLAAVLWRFLVAHERCVAAAAGTSGFELVTTVPSADRERDERHPLRWIVGELVAPTRERYQRLLRRSEFKVHARAFSRDKYEATRLLAGEGVLLIDDTWTTGANAQSAAAALKAAGAGAVAAVVIGRHLNREWQQNDRRLRSLAESFEWETCVLFAPLRESFVPPLHGLGPPSCAEIKWDSRSGLADQTRG